MNDNGRVCTARGLSCLLAKRRASAQRQLRFAYGEAGRDAPAGAGGHPRMGRRGGGNGQTGASASARCLSGISIRAGEYPAFCVSRAIFSAHILNLRGEYAWLQAAISPEHRRIHGKPCVLFVKPADFHLAGEWGLTLKIGFYTIVSVHLFSNS